MKNQLKQGSENKPMPMVTPDVGKIVVFVIGLVTFNLLSGCGIQPSPVMPTVDETKIALEMEATAMRNFLTSQAATLLPATQPAPTIPPAPPSTATAGATTLLTNENEGYALRYPPEYHAVLYGRSICFTPAQVVDGRPGACHVANAILDVSDVEGQTLVNAADEVAATGNPSIEVTRTEIKIGKEDAILLDNIYSYDVLRKVVVIHGNRLYVFTFVPWVEGIDEFQRLHSLYTTLTESFTFLSQP